MRTSGPRPKGSSGPRKVGSVLLTLGCLFLTVLGAGLTYDGASGLIGAITHDDPVIAGPGRLHDAFLEAIPCNRNQSLVCDREPSAKLDLPNGHTEVLNQEPLYDLVRRAGPVTVEIEWDKELASATRVRYEATTGIAPATRAMPTSSARWCRSCSASRCSCSPA